MSATGEAKLARDDGGPERHGQAKVGPRRTEAGSITPVLR